MVAKILQASWKQLCILYILLSIGYYINQTISQTIKTYFECITQTDYTKHRLPKTHKQTCSVLLGNQIPSRIAFLCGVLSTAILLYTESFQIIEIIECFERKHCSMLGVALQVLFFLLGFMIFIWGFKKSAA